LEHIEFAEVDGIAFSRSPPDVVAKFFER